MAVFLGVALAGRSSVLVGVVRMSGRGMGMMRRFLVIAGLVMLGGFTVVLSGLRVVGGGVLVALGCFFRHGLRGIYGAPLAVRGMNLQLA